MSVGRQRHLEDREWKGKQQWTRPDGSQGHVHAASCKPQCFLIWNFSIPCMGNFKVFSKITYIFSFMSLENILLFFHVKIALRKTQEQISGCEKNVLVFTVKGDGGFGNCGGSGQSTKCAGWGSIFATKLATILQHPYTHEKVDFRNSKHPNLSTKLLLPWFSQR